MWLGCLFLWVTWTSIGFWYVKITPSDWLHMMSDDRNVRYPWMSIPALILCWIFWPIYPWLSRQLFLFALKF